MLDFLPGERLKFITVTIVDNPVPELDKIFRVELYNADGGGEKFESKIMMVLVCVTFDIFCALELSTVYFKFSTFYQKPVFARLRVDCFCVFCLLCSCVLPRTQPKYATANPPSFPFAL